MIPSTSRLSEKKNSQGKYVKTERKEILINIYKEKVAKHPNATYKELRSMISAESGIGLGTISKTISEYKRTGTVSTRNFKRFKPGIMEKLDEEQQKAIRRHVYDFWFRREAPNIKKILFVVNENEELPKFSETNFRRVLQDLNFSYSDRRRNIGLIERDDIILRRRHYIRKIRQYRKEGRSIYYLDEALILTEATGKRNNSLKEEQKSEKEEKGGGDGGGGGGGGGGGDDDNDGLMGDEPTPPLTLAASKRKFLIVLHIGSEKGFVHDALLCLESSKSTLNNHGIMNSDVFFEWFQRVLPKLEENAVIVMDDDPCHSMKVEYCPTSKWKKSRIASWLNAKNQCISSDMLKVEMLDLVDSLKPKLEKYVVDKYAEQFGKTVLRLPPFHYELNPIELAWAYVKSFVNLNNTSFQLSDVQELINQALDKVTVGMWKNFIKHVIVEEDLIFKLDNIVEEIQESAIEPQSSDSDL